MTSTFNITEIIIANAMGLAILFVIAVGNYWRLKENSRENKSLLIMFFCCVFNCIADPVCFLADGKAGLLNRILIIVSNTLLYVCGAVTALAWIFLIATRLQLKLHKVHRTVLYTVFAMIIVSLVANIFVPIMFSVDESNVYARLAGYWVYAVYYVGFLLDGLILYLRQRYMSGGLKFFPVLAFIVPASLGILIQAASYGVSAAIPFVTVSLAGVIIGMQNEFMFKDKLTGLYNRFYLDTVEKRMTGNQKVKYSAIMLDINDFKKINDTYGHNMGDAALIRFASILTDVVGRFGEVVRYAGDEFIIIVNTQDDARIDKLVFDINDLLDKFNREKTAPYELSAAAGYCKLDFKANTMEEYIGIIDKLMYEDKQNYYKSHVRYDRYQKHGSSNND